MLNTPVLRENGQQTDYAQIAYQTRISTTLKPDKTGLNCMQHHETIFTDSVFKLRFTAIYMLGI